DPSDKPRVRSCRGVNLKLDRRFLPVASAWWPPLPPPLAGANPLPDLPRDRGCQTNRQASRSIDLIKIARIRHVNRDVLLIELLRKRFQLRRRRNQNDLRLERDDALDAGMHRVADLGDALRGFGIIAISRVANESFPGPHCVNNLR